MLIYLAGPMRGYPQFNFPAFDAAAQRLRALGHDVFNPADHDRATHGDDFADGNDQGDEDAAAVSHGFNLRDALGADLAFITAHADAVAVLPDWEKSKGATAEVSTALALDLLVAPFDEFAAAWKHDLGYKCGDDRITELPRPDAAQYASVARVRAELDALTPPIATPYASGGFVRGPGMGTDDSVPVFGDVGHVLTAEQAREVFESWKAPTLTEWAERTEPVDLSGLTGEVRSVSATGGEKGVKPARFDLLPTYPLTVLAEHYGKGAAKYDAHNWRRGYAWSNSFAALMRHAWAWWDGEDIDAETGSPHTAAMAFHAFALIQFARDFPEFDDRYKEVTE